MPPPLGKTPTKKMPNIQVFGLEDSQRDPRPRSGSSASGGSSSTSSTCARSRSRAGELRRFTDRLGAAALLDTESRAVPGAGPRLPRHGHGRDHRAGSSPTCA